MLKIFPNTSTLYMHAYNTKTITLVQERGHCLLDIVCSVNTSEHMKLTCSMPLF